MIQRLVPIIIIWALVDLYFFQAVKTATNNVYVWWAYWLYDILLAIVMIYIAAMPAGPSTQPRVIFWLIGFMLLSLAPKLISLPILIFEDAGRLLWYVGNFFRRLFSSGESQETLRYAGRRKFISQLAIGIAAIPFIGLLYGMIRGKYDYRVHKLSVRFKDLPDAFNGFTITQLSDIHSGSFDSKTDVERGIALANAQKSDIFLFTGDLVNNNADEMTPWKESFSALRAPYGQFSVLGNHDYGDYQQWASEAEKAANLVRLKQVHQEIGFRLMLNESLQIKKDGQHISLIGVENWGKGGFHKYGDLNKATAAVEDNDFKILMSHDPSHWEAQTLNHNKHIHLTLAGHTHGMQFGIEVPGFKWSPVQYVYRQWAGIYQRSEKKLYVNRGFGFLGYPGRVGILPEITVITLLKA
ncbi:metallophosphoesterase [Segetibacter sp. 3557_3]|uniref:metallophosphoesterase n=1 Tax=Segetibacter sp. 3557_3 TaxID=2547429 RepID=UPI0010584E06|nr:metallophosphoesterase [Segetibacter sp. 3557_3]TDH21408.1 metallophosphoesterase [Segetibacter sp. 3557_3]